ncbi:hypothetical protein CRU98_06915 [Arcobacter sp. CECT 8986]|uniref:hypothetical protein n=1 Tax=Arcobacter sp. CECT 8986 TaxID=2044507 RepID=UPI001009CD24|nr:hypothetical protein [Arcobacter sp. CECT 8986]RXJ99087.1 hypothetical protein CRU98_06915 [Arcobacter sp. CECT 8986]
MKNLLLLLTTIVVAIAFSGCGMKQNELGYYVPSSKEELVQAKNQKIFFKDYTPIVTKNSLLKLKNFIENSKYSYNFKFEEEFNYTPTKDTGILNYNYPTSFFYSGERFDNDILEGSIKKINKPFDFKLVLKDNVLVSTKKYSNYNDIIKDMRKIELLLQDKYNSNIPDFINTYETSFRMVLDDNYLKQYKLAFTVPRKVFSYGSIIKKQLKEYGYTLVDNVKDANTSLLYENSVTLKGTDLKYIKKLKVLANINSSSNLTQIGDTSMKLTNISGHSSLHSAQAGLAMMGVSLLFDFLTSGSKFHNFGQIKIINNKTGLVKKITLDHKTLYSSYIYNTDMDSIKEDIIKQLKTDEYKHFRNQVAYRFERIKI